MLTDCLFGEGLIRPGDEIPLFSDAPGWMIGKGGRGMCRTDTVTENHPEVQQKEAMQGRKERVLEGGTGLAEVVDGAEETGGGGDSECTGASGAEGGDGGGMV